MQKDLKETQAEPVPLHLRNPVTALMRESGYGRGYGRGWITAVIMTAPGTIMMAKLFVPETETPKTMGKVRLEVPKTDVNRAMEVTEKIAKDLGAARVDKREDISKVSIVGVGMRTHSGVAAKMFQTLARHNINIMMISTSEIKISCIIEEKYTELAVRVLHEAFELENGPAEDR